jgi:hypothetical protein
MLTCMAGMPCPWGMLTGTVVVLPLSGTHATKDPEMQPWWWLEALARKPQRLSGHKCFQH